MVSFFGNYTFYNIDTLLSLTSINPHITDKAKYYDYHIVSWSSGSHVVTCEQIEFGTSSTSFTFNSIITNSGTAGITVSYRYYMIRIA